MRLTELEPHWITGKLSNERNVQDKRMEESKYNGPGVGMPALLKLEAFGVYVENAFGHPPSLVGSALTSKTWRDVDVRLVLPDDLYVKVFDLELSDPSEFVEGADLNECAARDHWNRGTHACGRWVALCLAFSALGKEMTGLPIDFQIQPATIANCLHPRSENPRYYLGMQSKRLLRNESNSPASAPA